VLRHTVALSAATIAVAALGVSACARDAGPVAEPTVAPPAVSAPAPPAADPLPPPEALTDVLYRLADPELPGRDKIGLVEHATPDDIAALDGFGRALRDGGYLPVTFTAEDLAWSDAEPGVVVATVVAETAKPEAGRFTLPMAFVPHGDGWQLTRATADLLLELTP